MSGIYIPKTDMPSSCVYCPLSGYGTGEYCALTDGGTLEDTRRDDCPLVCIPAHGPLIAADELFKEMERKGWFDNADRDKAEDIVLDAPAVIPAEEVET